MISDKNAVVAVFDSHERAEDAIRELEKSGFDMKKLSIIGKDYHSEEHVVGYYNTGERMKYWGKLGAFWGGFWGMLFGSAFFWLPGIGTVLVAGPLVVWIVGALKARRLWEGSALGGRIVQHRYPARQCPSVRNPGEEWKTRLGCTRDVRGSRTRQGPPQSNRSEFNDRPRRNTGHCWGVTELELPDVSFRTEAGRNP